MIPAWLTTTALAAATDTEVHAAVEALYGREIPEAAVCVARPDDLPGRFHDVAAAGVKRGHRGCVLVGVMLDAELLAPEVAARHAVDPEAWQMVDPAQRAQDLLAWTRSVLLASSAGLLTGRSA